ncbi:hypothetical protein DYB32_002226, partial [Aphanomyces invadans]
ESLILRISTTRDSTHNVFLEVPSTRCFSPTAMQKTSAWSTSGSAKSVDASTYVPIVFATHRHPAQVNVMAYDYTGYGISLGVPSEEAVYSDVEAAFAYLVDVKKTPPSRIILYLTSHPQDKRVTLWLAVGTGGRWVLAAWRSLPLWVQDAGHNNIEAFLGYSRGANDVLVHLVM